MSERADVKRRPRRSRRPRSAPAAERKASRAKPRRRSRWIVLPALALVLLAAMATALAGWATTRGSGGGKALVFEVETGSTRLSVARRLAELGVLASPRLFALYAAALRSEARFVPGLHYLRDDLSARQLVDWLARLKSRPTARFTIPEGFNFRGIAARLDERRICPRESFSSAVFDPELLRELEISGPSAEGYLFPATYDLFVNSDPKAVVRQMAAETRRRLAALRRKHAASFVELAPAQGFGEHEILTLASVVEKEAARDEHALVASVFYNRLSDPTFRPARMLQSDPTAGYGCLVTLKSPPSCQGYAGQVTPAMLRDGANPYNTYRHAGLPPGPISNPGESALSAVLAPAKTDYLYFVAKAGRHVFSRSFAEHRAAIEAK